MFKKIISNYALDLLEVVFSASMTKIYQLNVDLIKNRELSAWWKSLYLKANQLLSENFEMVQKQLISKFHFLFYFNTKLNLVC